MDKAQKIVLKDINLKIFPGDFICIMGENGCGKTTLVRHMNGLILPTSGNVYIENINTKQIYDHAKIAKIISMTFQNPDEQIISSVVEDEIAFNLENICYPSDKMPQKIAQVLKFVGLEGYEKIFTSSLSGGQKQKLLIACALAVEPRVIILDETTSMLDATAQRDIMNILLKTNQTLNTSIIMITHNTYEAVMSKKVILMKDGKIEIVDKPQNIFTDFKIMKKFGIVPLQSTVLLKKVLDSGYDVHLENSLDNRSCVQEIMNILENSDAKN